MLYNYTREVLLVSFTSIVTVGLLLTFVSVTVWVATGVFCGARIAGLYVRRIVAEVWRDGRSDDIL